MRLRAEEGHTLTEVLLAAALMLVIFGGALSAYLALNNQSNVDQKVNDAQDRVRTVLDQMAHDLRNLAGPTASQPNGIDKATATDLVFQTVDPSGPNSGQNTVNVERVRYCLNTANANNELLYRQIQRWTSSTAPSAPSTSSCPSSDGGWTKTTRMADSIVNYYAGQTRPVFTYDTATLPSITWIVPQLFIDVNPGAQPAETNLKTGLYLRNQNRAPSAGFSVAVSANVLGTARVVLNATISQDPEGDQLTYVWFDGSTKLSACNSLAVCSTTLTGSGTHNISLQVLDSAGLSATATQAVTVL